MHCGLLGRKLGHSYSPQIHAKMGTYSYALYEKEPEELEAFLKTADFTGINVTVPYKKAVIPFLDTLSPRAQALGAVNTVVRRNGKLIGHNTDFFGFEQMLSQSGLKVRGQKILVLGSGGASNTVVSVLRHHGADPVVISRSGENNYGDLHLHTDARGIVNTTPVGMYPNTGIAPLELTQFPQLTGVLDLIYNPARTALLQQAEALGLTAVNGLFMLVAQAAEASEWFTGSAIAPAQICCIHAALRRQSENIVLIGMPGSGKTTVGRLLAEKCGKRFVDADDEIAALAGKSIPQIFAQDGEAAFRTWETQVLRDLGKQSDQVIATGGGCVTREENYPHLHQNGTIFYLDRALSSLPTEGRPLSQAGNLEEMYRIRRPLYGRFADHLIDCNGTVDAAVQKILTLWEETP